jgi:hypothetical protein
MPTVKDRLYPVSEFPADNRLITPFVDLAIPDEIPV